MTAPAVSPAQWDLLVWYAVAIHDDGRTHPSFKPMARSASVTPQAARTAWTEGLPHLGQPSLRIVRGEISSGARPFPERPEGAPPATSRLAAKVTREKRPPAPASPPAPARVVPPPPPSPRAQRPPTAPQPPPPPAPHVDPDEGDPWDAGNTSAPTASPDDVAAALGQVAFPGEEPPVLPTFRPKVIPQSASAAGRQAQRDAAGDELDPTAQYAVDTGEREADAPFDPATAVDDTPPLPSAAARHTGQALSAIDKEQGERALLENRLDAIDIAGRARTGANLGVYATQLLMSGAVPLARRARYEMIQLARAPAAEGAPFDVEKALSLLQRATQVARTVSTVATNAMTISRNLTEDLRTHLKALDAVGATVGPGGESVPGSDADLLREMEHEQERLARDRARLARKMQGDGDGDGGDGEAGAPPSPESSAGGGGGEASSGGEAAGETSAEQASPPAAPVAEAPPPVTLAMLLTAETLGALGDAGTQERGRECLADGRVVALAMGADGVLTGTVLGSEVGAEYQPRLWVAEGQLARGCTCAQGQIGRDCKHLVALGLGWLASRAGVAG